MSLIYQKRFLARGPRIVAIGGGHGLSTLLRGLKEHTSNLTAIVTVADDGGSSGMLRDQSGDPGGRRHPQLPRGPRRRRAADERRPPVPLPDAAGHGRPRPGRSRHRQPADRGDDRGRGQGDFEDGVRRMNRILAVRGQVVPVSATPLTLHAAPRRRHGRRRPVGRDRRTPGIDRVWLTPRGRPGVRGCPGRDRRRRADRDRPGQPVHEHPAEPAPARDPGRVLAASAPPDLRLQRRDAGRRDRRATTWPTHVEALVAHTSPELVDIVLANNQFGGRGHGRPRRPRRSSCAGHRPRLPPPRLILDDVVDPANPHHHDPARLALAIIKALEHETGAPAPDRQPDRLT